VDCAFRPPTTRTRFNAPIPIAFSAHPANATAGVEAHNRTAAATGGLREAFAPPTCALASTGDHPAAGRTNCFEYTDAMGEA
jgi:hypothetical protein